MGYASWRAHDWLGEYATLVRAGVAVRIRGRASLEFADAALTGLNEVGVTDLVLAAIWKSGPRGAARAISSTAENEHLGADIAIVQQSKARILLYQAKLAAYCRGTFRLKSKVTKDQLDRLRRQDPVEIAGSPYCVAGRLALYQHERTPYLKDCPDALLTMARWRWLGVWPDGPGLMFVEHGAAWEPDPLIGRSYYEGVLAAGGCSPAGVLAARIPDGVEEVNAVPEADTWPWEFDTHHWLGQTGPGEDWPPAGDGPESGKPAPDFEAYFANDNEPRQPDQAQAAAIADELAVQLQIPAETRLYVITLP